MYPKTGRNIKLLKKKNAWANMLAILGTAAYLQSEIRVCVNGHTIKCSPQHTAEHATSKHKRSKRVISLHFARAHYSSVDAAEVRHRLAVAGHKWSSSLKEFLNNPLDDYPKDIAIPRYRINFTRTSRNRIARPGRVDSMPPQYRPAGPGLPTRRQNEDFASQALRVAKAKVSVPAVGIPLAHPVPRVPPQPPAPPPRRTTATLMAMTTKASAPTAIRAPKEPPYPPPGRERTTIPQPKTPPKAPVTPPRPPRSRRTPSETMAWSTSSATTTASDTHVAEIPSSSARPLSTADAPEIPGPSTRPVIITAAAADAKAPFHRLITKPRTPPPSRRNMPSAAPPVIELPPVAEDGDSMSGGECDEDNVNVDAAVQRAPLEVLVNRVVNEVSRRVLESLADAPYIAGFSEGDVWMRRKLQCSSPDSACQWNATTKRTSLISLLLPTIKHPRKQTRAGLDARDSSAAVLTAYNFGLMSSGSDCGHKRIIAKAHQFLYIRGLWLVNLIGGLFFSGITPTSDYCTQPVNDKLAYAKSAETKCHEKGCNTHPRSGEREQHDASADESKLRQPTSFAATGLFCRWVVSSVVMCYACNNEMPTPTFNRTLQGGMLNHFAKIGIASGQHKIQCNTDSDDNSLDDCARRVLIGDGVCVENIRILLDHPEAPWIPTGNGHQITLGAARLSLTRASNKFPNFTQVITTYMKQCNSRAHGTTIVINKNMKTAIHTDSRNEKLPAHITAITNYRGGEIFLQSEHGDKHFDERRGFLVQIPMGNTISVPTFKIPHATNSWVGNRIIAVLFSCPLKRIEACKDNLKSKLQRLGFHIPELNKSWIDCEITGNSNGNPVYSRPTSIRGFFNAGDHQRCLPRDGAGNRFGISDCGVWEVSSSCETEPDNDLTRTWSNLFDLQLSDIECCPEEAPSPASTELDSDSEWHNSVHDASTNADARCRKRKNISPTRTADREPEREAPQRRLSIHRDNLVEFAGLSSPLRWDSDVSGDDHGNHLSSEYEHEHDVDSSAHCSKHVPGISDEGRWMCRSSHSDPIEDYTDDEDRSNMCGGGGDPADEFQPIKAGISKLVQKLKNVPHGYAPKQIRMLLTSDSKFYRKIERTADAKQLRDCVAAAAKRMGLIGSGHENQNQTTCDSVARSSWQQPDAKASLKIDGKANSGKGGLTSAKKGKGKGDIQAKEQKGRGKSKNGNDTNIHKPDP